MPETDKNKTEDFWTKLARERFERAEPVVLTMACSRSKTRRAKREPKKLELKAGDRVMRKSDRERGVYVGEVVSVGANYAQIKWSANWRIGGGSLHTRVKLTSRDLYIATDELIAERRIDVRFANLRRARKDAFKDYGADWLARNNMNEAQWFEKRNEKVFNAARKLAQGGVALLELREKTTA